MKQKPYQSQDFKEVLDWAADRQMKVIDGPEAWDEVARLRYDQAKQKELVILTKEDVYNQVVAAMEGGSNYWYDIGAKSYERVKAVTPDAIPFVDRLMIALDKGVHVNIFDINEPVSEVIDGEKTYRKKLGTLTEFSWAKAEKLMFQHHKHHLGDILREDYDATTGDVFFQLAVMGELVFG